MDIRGSRPCRLALALALALAALAPLPARAAAADDEGAWAPMAAAGARIPRDFPAAVWTGTELLIWGGSGGDALKFLPIGGGGRYNPATDTWRPMATTGGPLTWGTTVGVWTGTEAIFWSGQGVYGGAPGAAYHPDSDAWTPLPTAGAPGLPTSGQAAVWTGKELIVWAGPTASARYDPAANRWRPVSAVGAPSAGRGAVALWTGRQMLVWGGGAAGAGPRGGAAYDPATDAWSPLPTAGAPSARTGFSAVWTGAELLIWGGFGLGLASGGSGDGAAYNPATRTWRPLPAAGAPSRRGQALTVWTGGAMVIWGGDDGRSGALGDGAAYLPAADAWRPLPPVGAPSPRIAPTGVWTGSQLIVWGGSTPFLDPYADGGRFLPPPPEVHPARCFVQTGFCVDNDAIWDYFNRRGGVTTFGYPTSRTVLFFGHPSQFFQRDVLQVFPGGAVHPLNLLDAAGGATNATNGRYGILPFTSFNFSTFPAADPALAAQAPNVFSSPNYAAAVVAFVRAHAPDSWNGLPVRFYQTFVGTVSLADAYPAGGGNPALLPLLNLEIWGVPISDPAYDPHDHNFVYQRFQRGVMHYDAACNCTQGILMGDYLKAVITGQDLPADLAEEAADSPFLRLYAPDRPGWVSDPNRLPATDLTDAFVPE